MQSSAWTLAFGAVTSSPAPKEVLPGLALYQVKVHELVNQAVQGSVDIPEFQRDFVWDPEQSKLLADSLYQDYPVGSVLLWDSRAYQESRTVAGPRTPLWIVDGQQRTTALCLLLGKKPYWWPDTYDWNKALSRYDVMVRVVLDGPGDTVEFGLRNPVRERDPRWISLRAILGQEQVGNLTALAQEVAQRLTPDPQEVMKRFATIHHVLYELWLIRERDIPVVQIGHEIEDVAEIFRRLNQAGTRVKEADVTLALAAVRNRGWVREQYLPLCRELEERGWDLDAGIYIRTMAGVGAGRTRLAELSGDLWEPPRFLEVWRLSSQTIREVLLRLAEFGILSDAILPSTNSLIPLFVLHHRFGQGQGYRFGQAFRWFLLANRDGRYSGSAVTSLNEDVRAITEADSFATALDALYRRLRVTDVIAEEFLLRYDRSGSRFLRLMLYLALFEHEAKDWVDKTRIAYEPTGGRLAAGFEPHWHHIFPRALLRRHGIKDDDIHALANITAMNGRTNVKRLSDNSPARSIRDLQIQPFLLQAHLIPEPYVSSTSDAVWSTDRYHDFLVARAELLAGECNRFLARLDSA